MSDDGKQKRRGGKSRQRTKRRITALRRDALPTPLPRRRQPSIDKDVASHLAAAAEFADTLEHDGAELQKSRLKLDEIVQLLNSGTDPASIMNLIESALQDCRETFAEGRKNIRRFQRSVRDGR